MPYTGKEQNIEERTCQTPLEDLRRDALKHYDEASSAIHHWKSFVENAIKAYIPAVYASNAKPTADVSIDELSEKSWRKEMGVNKDFGVNPFYSMGFKAGYAAKDGQVEQRIGEQYFAVSPNNKKLVEGWYKDANFNNFQLIKATNSNQDGQVERMFTLEQIKSCWGKDRSFVGCEWLIEKLKQL